MVEKDDKFEGNDPFDICKRWITEAETGELNDPNAIALARFPRWHAQCKDGFTEKY